MYAVLISALVSAATVAALWLTGFARPMWAVFWGVPAFGATMLAIGFIVRRRVAKVMAELQSTIAEGQKAIQARVSAWQLRPKGDPRSFMDSIQKKQAELIHQALELTGGLDPYRRWVPFMQRQINTTRMQFWYQLRRFDKVDELLPKCLVLDPFSASMKLARQYSTNVEISDIEKTYRKARARLRYNQSAMLSSVMAWIYVRRNMPDAAYQLLDKACKDNNTDSEPNATLQRNRDALANNRVKQFSNAAFGDAWYALFLEEPKIRYERRPPPGRFGKFG